MLLDGWTRVNATHIFSSKDESVPSLRRHSVSASSSLSLNPSTSDPPDDFETDLNIVLGIVGSLCYLAQAGEPEYCRRILKHPTLMARIVTLVASFPEDDELCGVCSLFNMSMFLV